MVQTMARAESESSEKALCGVDTPGLVSTVMIPST